MRGVIQTRGTNLIKEFATTAPLKKKSGNQPIHTGKMCEKHPQTSSMGT